MNMLALEQKDITGCDSAAERALGQIGRCLRRGCVICIEHTPLMAPRFTPWQPWGKRCCYNGDTREIYTEINRCRDAHADHHIRLNIEDYDFRSRFSLVVHSPSVEA
ncbi:MAG: ribulose bisphosphate carboxylase small subunit [Gammaproteobacteria bacterium]|nr:ribulose bisphosphate carboxylase small subunit [Gammaproteobacteria bacterium]MCB1818223.1 ribulose bisphosphate carboxylase small subunit [Gammaproteobacteria bacterium]MCP5434952.1 ribulose bisphosphate carboxylase small subunit [Chromatiaceae bacterium]